MINKVELWRITNDIGKQNFGRTSPPRTVVRNTNIYLIGNRTLLRYTKWTIGGQVFRSLRIVPTPVIICSYAEIFFGETTIFERTYREIIKECYMNIDELHDYYLSDIQYELQNITINYDSEMFYREHIGEHEIRFLIKSFNHCKSEIDLEKKLTGIRTDIVIRIQNDLQKEGQLSDLIEKSLFEEKLKDLESSLKITKEVWGKERQIYFPTADLKNIGIDYDPHLKMDFRIRTNLQKNIFLSSLKSFFNVIVKVLSALRKDIIHTLNLNTRKIENNAVTKDSSSGLIKRWKEMIASDDIDDCFAEMRRYFDNQKKIEDEIILLQSRWKRCRENDLRDSVPRSETNYEKNKINSSLLQLLSDISTIH